MVDATLAAVARGMGADREDAVNAKRIRDWFSNRFKQKKAVKSAFDKNVQLDRNDGRHFGGVQGGAAPLRRESDGVNDLVDVGVGLAVSELLSESSSDSSSTDSAPNDPPDYNGGGGDFGGGGASGDW